MTLRHSAADLAARLLFRSSGSGALFNSRLPANSRTLVCALFMIPTIAGALGFLLAPTDAYVGRCVRPTRAPSFAVLRRLMQPIFSQVDLLLPDRLVPGNLRAQSQSDHQQHRRPDQEDDHDSHDLARRLHRVRPARFSVLAGHSTDSSFSPPPQ
jgi:hypothetical protein